MATNISGSDLLQSFQQIQEKYEELAIKHQAVINEHESSQKEGVRSLSDAPPSEWAILLPGPHSKEEIQRHIEETKAWRRKNPWALLKAAFYARKIKRLHLFDFEWYREQNSTNGENVSHPFRHFIRSGLFEGRDPSPGFSTWHYLERNLAKLNPAEPAIFHYIREGRKAGLSCNTNQMRDSDSLRLVLENISQSTTNLFAKLAKDAETSRIQTKKDLDTAMGQQSRQLQAELINFTKNEIQQLQDFITLQGYISGQAVPLEYRGWPISPDIGLFLVGHIIQNSYDLIVEFGSGTSTLLIAKTLQKMRSANPALKTRVVSFEHLAKYRAKTQAMLTFEALDDFATVVEAPLVPFQSFNGMSFDYYDCDAALSQLKRSEEVKISKVLALVDGPPQATSHMARLPALEVLAKHFPRACIDLILDDYHRDDEKASVREWEVFCGKNSRKYELIPIKAEKGAIMMTVEGAKKE